MGAVAAGPLESAATTAAPGRLTRLRAAALVLPGVGWLIAFFVVPLGIIFVVSLGSRDALDRISLAQPSIDNYVRAFDPVFLPTFLNSLRYAAITTILCLAIGYPIAYWISRYGGRHKVLLLILVMLPFWTSYLIRTYSWMILLRDNGVVNTILQAIGLIQEPIILMNTDISVILGMTYGFLPFAILPLFVSIDRLDPDLVAAGRDLYASGRSAFLHVTLPLTMPGIIAAGAADVHPGTRRLRHARSARWTADDDDRQEHPGAVPGWSRLAVRRGARVRPDGRDAHRHAGRPAHASPGGHRWRLTRSGGGRP